MTMAEESFFVRSRGKVTGPFDLAGLQRLVRLGMLSRVHELSADKQNWSPASRTPGLFPEAGAQTAGSSNQTPGIEADDKPPTMVETAEISETAVPVASNMQCASCGGIFPAAQVYLDRGRNLCISCFQKQSATIPGTAAGLDNGRAESYRGMAVTSMVLGICGLVIPLVGAVCALLAIIFGSLASRGNKRLGSRDGSGMATAGLVMGIIAAAGYVCWLIFFLVMMFIAAAAAAHGTQ